MISVCIATYNGEKFIKQQLTSILEQLAPADEIIVSDDNSKDNTRNIIEELNDGRIKIIDGPGMGSPTKNFEQALKHAKGDYIFLADQDDVWKEGKVSICMKYLKDYCCVVSDATVTDGDLKETSSSFFRLNNTKYGKWYNLLLKNGYLGCCMAFRKELLNAAIPFRKTPLCMTSGLEMSQHSNLMYASYPKVLFCSEDMGTTVRQQQEKAPRR